MTGEHSELLPPRDAVLPANVDAVDRVSAYVRASKAENTLRGYQADWRDFCAWCQARGASRYPRRPRPWRPTWPSAQRA